MARHKKGITLQIVRDSIARRIEMAGLRIGALVRFAGKRVR